MIVNGKRLKKRSRFKADVPDSSELSLPTYSLVIQLICIRPGLGKHFEINSPSNVNPAHAGIQRLCFS